jgi:hypothetical protein
LNKASTIPFTPQFLFSNNASTSITFNTFKGFFILSLVIISLR